MKISNIARKIVRNLPLVSLFRYISRDSKEDLKSRKSKLRAKLKLTGHLAYAASFIVPTSVYLGRTLGTAEWIPSEQNKVIEQIKQRRFEQEQDARLRDFYWGVLFTGKGYADANKDRAIDFNEKVDAWRRMGFEDEIFMEGQPFPEPTTQQLERAVQSYPQFEKDMKNQSFL